MVAEAKIDTVGRVIQMPDRADLYRELEKIKHDAIKVSAKPLLPNDP